MQSESELFSETVRNRLFPVTRQWIYFNHAAVGAMPAYVREAAGHYLDAIGSSGQLHWNGTGLLQDRLRQDLADHLGVTASEIAFTRNVTEGISILANGLDWQPGDNVLLPALEFPSNVYPWQNLARLGVEVRFIPMPEGRFGLPEVMALVGRRTRVLSISSVQFYHGFMACLPELGDWCRENGIIFCIDAIQQLGALPLNLPATGAGFLAAGGHKWWMAGEGIGFIACKPELAERLNISVAGWMGVKSWEDFLGYPGDFHSGSRRFESGNLSAFGLHTLAASLDFFTKLDVQRAAGQIRKLAAGIVRSTKERGWTVVTPEGGDVSGIVSIRIPGQDAAVLAGKLLEKQVVVSARNGALRLSAHFFNTQAEIGLIFERLDELISRR